MRMNGAVGVCVAGLCLGVFLVGSGTALAQTTEKKIEKVPVVQSNPSSGKQMFKDYCAVCHGTDGKGGGPAADALKTAPADLTTMAKRYGEKSVALKVEAALEFGAQKKAHGTSEMPVWGPLFSATDQNQPTVRMRITNLAKYVETLQQK
ncbi:MAG TPA: c-type cytochrome [Candidatus Acidoferrum sp.]|nr:c-type cytochrome [Candidatus Acidoferrum sp.]